jgi:pyridoxal phosphate enzyme (YggS family)
MIDLHQRERLQHNWQLVRQEVEAAAAEHGREADEITIVAVSKYVDADTTLALIEAGCSDLGESRPQSLWEKAESLQSHPGDVRWHLIGHLQRNKVRRTLRHQPVIHSIDSERLLATVADEAVAQNQNSTVFLEVNISGDAAKTGFDPEHLPGVLERVPSAGVRVVGLMAMAGRGTSSDKARRQFEQLRELRDRLASGSAQPLAELSMGMSNDFREAIAAGATVVRIGSRLFEGVTD